MAQEWWKKFSIEEWVNHKKVGATFWITRADKSQAVDYYRRISDRYNEVAETGFLELLRRTERKAVVALSDFKKAGTLIDVGCGGGYYALRAKDAGMRVTVIDVSKEMVGRLEGKVDEIGVADIEDLTVTKMFDRVICAGVLDFVFRPEVALMNLFRLARPGGKVILLVPRKGIGGEVYRIEKNLTGFDANLFALDWLENFASHNQMKMVNFTYPLPHNLAVVFRKLPNF